MFSDMDFVTTVIVFLVPLAILGWIFNSIKKREAPLKKDDDLHAEAEKSEPGFDCIIVGAGVAGAALAYALGKDGRRVLVIERDLKQPDRIVGELLQPGGYLKLIELGLRDSLEEIEAQRVFGYALYKDGQYAELTYPLEGYSADIAGRSFHNGRFVQRMRNKASSLESVQLIEGSVRSLLEKDGVVKGVAYKVNDEIFEAYAPLTFVCDGYASNLRKDLCHPKVEIPSSFVGLILENCQLPYANHGHVILADPSPILFYPISNTEVRCLVDCPADVMKRLTKEHSSLSEYLLTKVAPQLPPELQTPFRVTASDANKIRHNQNKSMPASPISKPGALLLGDAFNMRHPLTGGGMTVALSDIVVLRDMLRKLKNFDDSAELCTYLQAFYTRRKPVASTINTLAGALYRVFSSSPDKAMMAMQQACFDYLRLGWIFSSGPVALLSGLNPRPLSLVLHFFAVAIFGVGRLGLDAWRSPGNIWISINLLKGASAIIFPIIRAEGVMQMFFPRLVEMLNRVQSKKIH